MATDQGAARTARWRPNPTIVILAFVSTVSAFPLYFMVVMASRRNEDITFPTEFRGDP